MKVKSFVRLSAPSFEIVAVIVTSFAPFNGRVTVPSEAITVSSLLENATDTPSGSVKSSECQS